jgi:dUTP pyrophosphatase
MAAMFRNFGAKCARILPTCPRRMIADPQVTAVPSVKKQKTNPPVDGIHQLLCKRLSENAKLPTRGSSHAAGYDLYSAQEVTIAAEGKALVKTDIAVAIPEGHYGRVAPRSGLAWKHHIDCGAGVIDRDYRGNVGVILFNLAKQEFKSKLSDLPMQEVHAHTLVHVTQN